MVTSHALCLCGAKITRPTFLHANGNKSNNSNQSHDNPHLEYSEGQANADAENPATPSHKYKQCDQIQVRRIAYGSERLDNLNNCK